jgi:hypothetical protein
LALAVPAVLVALLQWNLVRSDPEALAVPAVLDFLEVLVDPVALDFLEALVDPVDPDFLEVLVDPAVQSALVDQ